jgi:FMN phosphatase YigB (HAD superfamily)
MPEIYQIAQEKAGVPAKEILFVDNRQKNIDGAKKVGWQTFFYDSKDYNKSSHDLGNFLNIAGK